MTIVMPQEVERIIATLERAGFEAYAVGGCVRDSILKRKPNDWDITTNAKPEEVKALFHRTVDTGIQHGTVTVMITRTGYEVTTYRLDGDYSDHRHPKSVQFTADLAEDLRRRDFTINAMAYNERTGVVDLYQGQEDLKNHIIRAVGNPLERFEEDALRILRAVRFAAQLGFSIEEETYAAAKSLSHHLASISKERIREELEKILQSHHPEYVKYLNDLGTMEWIFPAYPLNYVRILSLLKKVPEKVEMRTAAFFYLGKKASDPSSVAEKAMKELRYDNETKKKVLNYIRFVKEKVDENPVTLRRLMHQYETMPFKDLLLFYGLVKHEDLTCVLRIVNQIFRNEDCYSLKTLKITGSDLIFMGIPQGKMLGEILNRMLDMVIENPELNNREILRTFAENLKN